ncbi:MAG: betI [Firmicutes bacterium]|nr:betI [Bacillota bacterium]
MNITKKEVCTDKPTVTKIIEAAIPLFATKGLANVSVKELADAAGVNIALISYYFGGKDNLYAYILEDQLTKLKDAIETIKVEDIPAIMRMKKFADSILATNKNNPYICQFFHMEVFNPSKYFDTSVRNAVCHTHGFLRSCIEEAKNKGEIRGDVDAALAAMGFLKILNLSFTAHDLCKELMGNKEDLAAQYVAQALEIYLHGVAVQV